MRKAEEVRGGPATHLEFDLALGASELQFFLNCSAFCSHFFLLWDLQNFTCSLSMDLSVSWGGSSVRSNVANGFKKPAHPGDPASQGPDHALCFGLGWWQVPPVVVGPHCRLVASFPKEDLVTKRSWKFLCTQVETWQPCKGPRVRIKEKQNRNPSISN